MARRGSTTELAALLASLDLSAYLPAFVEDNLDDRSLVSLREGDLRALGIPATARRRFLEAVEERRHVPEALEQLGQALSREPGASPDQVREGVALHQETSRTAQRVLGGAHPTSKQLVASIEAGQQILAGVVVFAPTSGLLSYSRRG